MNLKTITFDADKYQLVPKVATDEMNAAAAYTETFAEAYTALLAAAPQPETLSPWLPIEAAPKDGTVFLAYDEVKNYPSLAFWSDAIETWAYYYLHTPIKVTHWMLLPQGPTDATAPEVE